MRPLTVLLGFVLGSTFAITVGLLGVALVFWLLGPEYPRLAGESAPLLRSMAIFTALTAAAALSFYGDLKRSPWRWFAMLALASGLGGAGWYYWPS